MKTKLLFLALILAIFSCRKTNDDADNSSGQEMIKSQVKEVVTTIFTGCEEVNASMVLESSYNTFDFVYVFNGTTLSYGDFSTALVTVYDSMANQQIDRITEKYAVLDNSTVLYTTNCTFIQHFRDGHSVTINPAVMMFIFKKTGNRWRWIYAVESYS
ncbi:MAG: hypothetical protein NTU44_13950 [Bacteroidetes bacterium]|nr:hypothetical protein [Bacteroidota bacterium]